MSNEIKNAVILNCVLVTFFMLCLDIKKAMAQSMSLKPIKAAFYNVENMFDTIDSPFVLDGEFTPKGRMRWGSRGYQAKIRDVARVISDIRADVIALAEVENENVVKDLVVAVEQTDYAYVHHNSSDRRGIDIAILYRPERFFIDSVQVFKIKNHSREVITLFGEIDKQKVILSACHLPSLFNDRKTRTQIASQAGKYFESLASVDSAIYCVVAGDFNATPRSPQMKAMMGEAQSMDLADEPRGYTYAYGNRRMNFDYFLINKALAGKTRTKVFTQSYLFDYDIGVSLRIKPTYHRGSYVGGTSDHLPTTIEIYN